jgi:type IV pilus assembly protein PilM
MAVKTPGVWGIDLGQCALKAIRVENLDGKVTATAFDYIEHPKILSQPDADPDQLTREALDTFLSRNVLKGDTVVISVPGQSGLARFVKLPPVEEKKIPDIVRFEAKQQIPFPLEEVVWDYQKLGAGEMAAGFAMETEIGLFAMKRDMVNRYLQHFKDVHVEVHVVQMAPLALCNYLSYDLIDKIKEEGAAEEDGGKKQCVVALDIGTDNSNLVITDGQKIIWQRPIPLGGNHFTRALTKDLKLTFAKAEHLKRNAVKSPDLKKILAALKPVLNDFVSEVQRSLGYFTNTHRDAHVKYLLALGNAFRLPGLPKFLQEKLQLEVRRLPKFERLEGETVLNAPQFSENVLSFAVAYGLALQGLKTSRLQTNLLPQEIQTERMIRAKKPWAAAAAAALLLAMTGLALGRAVESSAINNPEVATSMKKADDAIKRQQSEANKFKDAENRTNESKTAIYKIGSGVEERFNWPLLLQYIDDALPQPDGSKISAKTSSNVEAFKKYYLLNRDLKQPGEIETIATRQAFRAWQMRNADPTMFLADLKADKSDKAADKADKAEDFIRKNLVQINIEGVDEMYAEDLKPFYEAVLESNSGKLFGMKATEAGALRTAGKDKSFDKLPKKGWVVELRCYTYYGANDNLPLDFMIDTYVENLTNPEGLGFQISDEVKRLVREKISHVVVYSYAVIKNPEPGNFKYIKASSLPQVLGGGGGMGMGGMGRGGGEGGAGMFMKGRGAGAGGGVGPKPGDAAGPGGAGGAGDDKKGPTMNARDNWTPLGDLAGGAFGGGGGVGGAAGGRGGPGGGMPDFMRGMKQPRNPGGGKAPGPGLEVPGGPGGSQPPQNQQRVQTIRTPRTEFVILFIWAEPTPSDPDEGTTPPT